MLKIRLKRVGRKHDPSFRLVLVESTRAAKSGRYIESLGSYDARTDAKKVDGERVRHWLSVGAQPSDTAHNILVSLGVVEGKKINVLPRKSPLAKVKDASASEASPAPKSEKKPENVPEKEDSAPESDAVIAPAEETADATQPDQLGDETKEEKA